MHWQCIIAGPKIVVKHAFRRCNTDKSEKWERGKQHNKWRKWFNVKLAITFPEIHFLCFKLLNITAKTLPRLLKYASNHDWTSLNGHTSITTYRSKGQKYEKGRYRIYGWWWGQANALKSFPLSDSWKQNPGLSPLHCTRDFWVSPLRASRSIKGL